MQTNGTGLSIDFGSLSMPAEIFNPHKDDIYKTEFHKFMGDDYHRLPQRLKYIAEQQTITVNYRID